VTVSTAAKSQVLISHNIVCIYLFSVPTIFWY